MRTDALPSHLGGIIIAEDKIGIALGSYICADDGFTCTTLCSGHRGRSGSFILYVALFNIILLLSTIYDVRSTFPVHHSGNCVNIKFNHDHVPMITQNWYQSTTQLCRGGISIHSVVRMTQEKEKTRINNNIIRRIATMQVIGMQVPRTQELQTSAGRQEEWIRGALWYEAQRELYGSSLLVIENANATIMRVGLLFTVQPCARSRWQRRSSPSRTSCPQFVWRRHFRQTPS